MCFERTADGAPRFVTHLVVKTKIQVNNVFLLSARKVRSQALQAAVPAQSIRKKGIVHITTIKIGRALMTSQDLSQYYGCSAIDLTA
jgi:hypothetical protein